jgi:RNA-binding protein 39
MPSVEASPRTGSTSRDRSEVSTPSSNHGSRRSRSPSVEYRHRRDSNRRWRSRSPYYDDYDDYYDDYRTRRDRRRSPRRSPRRQRSSERLPAPRRRSRTPPPRPSPRYNDPVDRNRRTVFVQQLAARLRTRELIDFFERAGEVRHADIVRDRGSHRSRGAAYVEFYDYESVQRAVDLSGEKLLGIPVSVQLTEAEKNRLALEAAGGDEGVAGPNQVFIHNVQFSISEEELRAIFEPFGLVDRVVLRKDYAGRSKGSGYIR